MAPLTVSPLTRFHIHLPIASSSPLPPSLFFLVLFQTQWSGDWPNADTASPHTLKYYQYGSKQRCAKVQSHRAASM